MGALVEEIKSQKKKLFADLMLIKRFKLDLDECIAFASEPKHLKEAVAALFRKYVQSTVRTLDLDTDSQKEYNRQRTYLEKSVDSLKRKLAKDSEVHRIDNMRIMQENVSLIREINDLRREINFLKHEQVSLQVSEKRAKAGSQLESQPGSWRRSWPRSGRSCGSSSCRPIRKQKTAAATSFAQTWGYRPVGLEFLA